MPAQTDKPRMIPYPVKTPIVKKPKVKQPEKIILNVNYYKNGLKYCNL